MPSTVSDACAEAMAGTITASIAARPSLCICKIMTVGPGLAGLPQLSAIEVLVSNPPIGLAQVDGFA